MSNLVIYAAGPVDLGKDAPNWRSLLMKKLEEKGLSAVMFDPSTAYKHSSWGKSQNLSRSRYIEEINRQALDQASAFVVCLPKNQPSVGTPIELDFAYGDGKPVYLLTDISPGRSVYVDNRVPVENWIQVKDVHDPSELNYGVATLADLLQSTLNTVNE